MFDDNSRINAPIPAGIGARFESIDGFYSRFWTIPTSSTMYMSVQFSELVGGDMSGVGTLSGGPITTGSSSTFIQNFTTGQSIDLGPNNNLGFFIDTVPIPAPGTGVLVFVSVLSARRRRRA
ncbi:MAG: hypothetical protein SFZ23_01580 [Planctomycetota bacterium]|nr:hypothetical protein [Planctomycetota bacterium]